MNAGTACVADEKDPVVFPPVDPVRPSKARRGTIVFAMIASAFLSVFGLWTSLRYALVSWGTDPDSANNVMLWWGVRQHGLNFLKTWDYTQDNWLLSLVPLAFAQFALLGVKPLVVVISGWVIFIGCVGLAVVLARRIANFWLCLALLPFLLLAKVSVLGWPDMFTYSVTHNISVFWGLAALWLTSRWLSSGSPVSLAAAFLALVINAISDPWAMPAFNLPIGLAAIVTFMVVPRNPVRLRAAILFAVSLFAAVLCFTKLAGVLSFLPSEKFELASLPEMQANVIAILTMLASMFSPFPDLPVPMLGGAVLMAVVSGVLLALLGGFTVVILVRRYRDLEPAALFIVLVIGLSIAGITAAFILSVPQDLKYVGRFFLNLYVLLPVLICAGLARARGVFPRWRIFAACFASMIMLSGAASRPSAWTGTKIHIKDDGAVGLADFLESNGLHRGYGDFWASGSSAVSWVSGGEVLIRPVLVDPQTGRIAPRNSETSPYWYGAEEASLSARSFAVVAPGPQSCEQVAVCVDGLTKQFGATDQVLSYRNFTILVWNRPLTIDGP